MRRAILRFIGRWLSRELRDARARWLYGLELSRVWLTVPITAASMYVLWHWAFGLSFYFGISFVVAASLAILRGHVFTHPFRMILVAVAVVIGSFVIPSLAGDAWTAFRRGDTITALVLVGVVVLFWLLKRYLETGQIKGRKVPPSADAASPGRAKEDAVPLVVESLSQGVYHRLLSDYDERNARTHPEYRIR